MANAKKCDICGALYERYNAKGNKPNSLALTQEYKCNISDSYNYVLINRLDCCPECMSSINRHIEWIKLNRNVKAIVEDNGYMRETNKE